MNAQKIMNFDKYVVNYINDNIQYIKNAKQALEHIIESRKYDETSYPLSKEQELRFQFVAETLFKQGYFAHAGILHADLDGIEEESESEWYEVDKIHTYSYDNNTGQYTIGIDATSDEGGLVKLQNTYFTFTAEQMEEIALNYLSHRPKIETEILTLKKLDTLIGQTISWSSPSSIYNQGYKGVATIVSINEFMEGGKPFVALVKAGDDLNNAFIFAGRIFFSDYGRAITYTMIY